MHELCELHRKFYGRKKIAKHKTWMTDPILSDQRSIGLDSMLVTVAKHVWDDVIVECKNDHIAFKTSKSSVCNIPIDRFVARPLESIL